MNLFKLRSKKTINEPVSQEEILKLQEANDKALEQSTRDLNGLVKSNGELKRSIELQKIKLSKSENELKRIQSALTDEVADKEILEQRIQKIKSLNKAQEESLVELTEQKKIVISQINSLKEKVESLSENHSSKLDEINKIQLELASLKGQESTLKSKTDVLSGNRVSNTDVHSGLKSQIEETKKRIKKFEAQIKLDNEEILKCDKSIEILDGERIKLNKEVSHLLDKSEKLKVNREQALTKLEEGRLEQANLMEQKLEAEKEIVIRIENIREINSNQEKIQQSITRLNSEIKSIETEMSSTKTTEKVELETLKDLERDLTKKEKKRVELVEDLKILANETKKYQDKIVETQKAIVETKQKLDELRTREGSSLIEIDQVDRDYKKSKKEYEAVLSESIRLDNRVAELNKEFERVNLSLKELKAKESKALFNNANRKKKILSLEEQIKNATNEMIDHRHLLNELKGSEVEARESIINLELEKNRLTTQKLSLETTISGLRKSIDLLNLKVEKSTRAKEALLEEVEAQDVLQGLLSEDEQKLNNTNNELLLTLGSLKGRIEIGNNRIEAKAIAVEELATENNRLSSIADKLCDKLNSTIAKLETIEDKISMYESKIDQLNNEINKNTQLHAKNLEVIEESENIIVTLKDGITKKEVELASLENNNKRLDKLISKKAKIASNLEDQLEGIRSEVSNKNKKYDARLLSKKNLDDRIVALNLKVSENEDQHKLIQTELEVLNSLINDSEKSIENIVFTIETQNQKHTELTNKKAELLIKSKELQNKNIVSNEELTKIENSCYKLRSSMANLEAEINEIEDNLESNLVRKVQLSEEIKKLEQDTRNAKGEIIHLGKEIERSNSELAQVNQLHSEKLELLKIELDEKAIVEKEYKARRNEVNKASALVDDLEEKLDKSTQERITLKESIDEAVKVKGELLLKKDELIASLEDAHDTNRNSRKLLEGISLEIRDLRSECESLNLNIHQETVKSKTIIESLELLREQSRSLKGKKKEKELQLNREAKQSLRSMKDTLEVALSKIEFDASLFLDDSTIETIVKGRHFDGIKSYIESLPFVLSKIDFVKIYTNPNRSIGITASGTLRCEEELTKDLLRDNVKGRFEHGVRFKISSNSIKLEIKSNERDLGVEA